MLIHCHSKSWHYFECIQGFQQCYWMNECKKVVFIQLLFMFHCFVKSNANTFDLDLNEILFVLFSIILRWYKIHQKLFHNIPLTFLMIIFCMKKKKCSLALSFEQTNKKMSHSKVVSIYILPWHVFTHVVHKLELFDSREKNVKGNWFCAYYYRYIIYWYNIRYFIAIIFATQLG